MVQPLVGSGGWRLQAGRTPHLPAALPLLLVVREQPGGGPFARAPVRWLSTTACFAVVFCPTARHKQVMHSSKVYLKLNERLGIADHSMVLSIMLRCGPGLAGCERRLAAAGCVFPPEISGTTCPARHALLQAAFRKNQHPDPARCPPPALPAPQQDRHQPQGVWQLRGRGGADADAVPGGAQRSAACSVGSLGPAQHGLAPHALWQAGLRATECKS